MLVEVLFCELDGWAVGGSKWRCSWMSRHSVCGAGAGAGVLFDRGAGDGAGACADAGAVLGTVLPAGPRGYAVWGSGASAVLVVD